MNLLDKDKIEEVYRRFKKNNPNPKGELHFYPFGSGGTICTSD